MTHRHKNRADDAEVSLVRHRLCVCTSGSLITVIFDRETLISVSLLHFGQYRGKLHITVSALIFRRVFPPQMGHKSQFSFCIFLFIHSCATPDGAQAVYPNHPHACQNAGLPAERQHAAYASTKKTANTANEIIVTRRRRRFVTAEKRAITGSAGRVAVPRHGARILR